MEPQQSMTNMSAVTCAGIDVSKMALDVALRPSGTSWRSANDESGIQDVVERMQVERPELIVLESTGGLERRLVAALALAGLPVAVVNPRQVRDFAKATGRLAKTDAVDAAVLAHFAQTIKPTPRPLPDAQAQRLAAMVERRQQLVNMLTAEKNRAQQALPAVQEQIKLHIAWLEQALQELDTELDQTLQARPLWRERVAPAALGLRRRPARLRSALGRQRGPVHPLLADRLHIWCRIFLRGRAHISSADGIAANGEFLRRHDVGHAQVNLPVPQDSAPCPGVSARAERRVPFSHAAGAAFWSCLYDQDV